MFMHGKEKEHPFKEKLMRKNRLPVSTEDDQLKGSFLTVSGLCYILKRISVQGLAVSLGIWRMLALIGHVHTHTHTSSLSIPSQKPSDNNKLAHSRTLVLFSGFFSSSLSSFGMNKHEANYG